MPQIRPFLLERFFARYEFNAEYLLCSSDCESMSIESLLAYEPDAAARFQQQWLGYTESQGSPELRQTIAASYSNILPGQVLVHAGAEEAIFTFVNSMLSPGDHIIVHAPCYQSLSELARSVGCEVSLWQTHSDARWELDLQWLTDNIRSNTRAIVVNCPHNPTGYLMSRATQSELLAIARQYGLLVFSDEVYRGLEHSSVDRLPSACDLYENAVSLGVMSKTYGLAGLRIGWIATRNAEVYQRMAAFKDYLSICNSAPSEFLAILALRHHEAIATRNLEIIRDNLSRLDTFFARYPEIFDWQRPKAGSTAFPALRLLLGSEAFCTRLVEQAGVLLLPSTVYEYGDRHFRLGFGRRNLPHALDRLEQHIGAIKTW